MIFTCSSYCTECKLGTTLELSHPLPSKRVETVKGKIIRMTTREEFYDYWNKNDPEEFSKSLKLSGDIPESYIFYEAQID